MNVVELEVDDDNWPEFKKHFLRIHPNQTQHSDVPLDDKEWIAYRILLFARGAYIKGLQEEYEQQNGPDIDMDIITL